MKLLPFLIISLILFALVACSKVENGFETQINSTPISETTRLAEINIGLAFPNLSFDRLVGLTSSYDKTNRIFAVSQKGKLYVFENRTDVDSYTVFLDITEKVRSKGNEEGLLSLVFDPDYSTNGRFYVYYSASNPTRSIVSMFLVDENNPNKGNPNSEIVILEIPQPYSNHNGGSLVFGPDGYLYIGLGDGGSSGDPLGNGQNPNTLLGSILRINLSKISKMNPYLIPEDNPFVDVEEIQDEIWAYGLRNPWRMSFDSLNNNLWVGDVGQNSYEEINIIVSGGNYGWNIMEGFHCYNPKNDCAQSDLELPVFEYETGKKGNCSVVGGPVYNGSKFTQLTNAYIFGDYCSGKIWALKYGSEGEILVDLITDSRIYISSFGEGEDGELYILGLEGNIYKFVLNKVEN